MISVVVNETTQIDGTISTVFNGNLKNCNYSGIFTLNHNQLILSSGQGRQTFHAVENPAYLRWKKNVKYPLKSQRRTHKTL